MAKTVHEGSSTPLSMTASCCRIRVGRGTSSSFVHPPKGWSRRIGLRRVWSSLRRVSCIRRACPLWMGLRSWKAKTASASETCDKATGPTGMYLSP